MSKEPELAAASMASASNLDVVLLSDSDGVVQRSPVVGEGGVTRYHVVSEMASV